MVDSGDFRRDLFYRLRGIRLQLPPLRAISEDINELTCKFIQRHCKRFRMASKGFSPDFLDALMHYEWPGNIRELMNTLEQALSRAGKEHILYPRHLPRVIRAQIADGIWKRVFLSRVFLRKGAPSRPHVSRLSRTIGNNKTEIMEKATFATCSTLPTETSGNHAGFPAFPALDCTPCSSSTASTDKNETTPRISGTMQNTHFPIFQKTRKKS